MDIKDYKLASLEFRRVASNMLMADSDNANIQLIRFKNYIDSNPIISSIIQDAIRGIEYNFRECFLVDGLDWSRINPPINESFHLRAQYDYISHICSNDIEVLDIACGFYCGSRKLDDIVRSFLGIAFKPLVDLITDGLSKEIMLLEDNSPTGNFAQIIENNYGTVNAAGRDIKSSNTTIINDIDEIKELIEKLLPTISDSELTPTEKEDLTDDLESISEQIQSDKPKATRIKKAYENIKSFIVKVAPGAGKATLLLTDWQRLIEKLGELIASIS